MPPGSGRHASYSETELPERPGCFVLDVRMPGSSGLDLQQHLAESGNTMPIVFLTGHGDIPMSVQAMKAGAVDFLTKPFRDQSLLDAVSAGIERRRCPACRCARGSRAFRSPRDANRARTPGVARSRGAGGLQQADRLRSRHQRSHRETPPQQRDAKMEARTIGELIRAWDTLPEKSAQQRTRLGYGYILPRIQRHPKQARSFLSLGSFRLFEPPLIAVVDDDEAVRQALCDLFQVEGLSARGFAGAGAFLDDLRRGGSIS